MGFLYGRWETSKKGISWGQGQGHRLTGAAVSKQGERERVGAGSDSSAVRGLDGHGVDFI